MSGGIKSLKLSLFVVVCCFASAVHAQSNDRRATLHVLAIGVSQFADSDPRLPHGVQGAANDARDIGNVLRRQEGVLYHRVDVVTLTNAQATRGNIERALDDLKRVVRSGDTVIVFAASHGCLYQNQYYFVTHDYDPADPASGLRWSSFMQVLANLPGSRMLILDTCHAGAAVGAGVDLATRELHAAGLRSGVIVYGSCTGEQGSGQITSRANGIFTVALVEALGGRADLDTDGVVTLAEMDAYVDNRVRALSGGRQHPTMQRPAAISSSFCMARLGGATVASEVASGPAMPQPVNSVHVVIGNRIRSEADGR